MRFGKRVRYRGTPIVGSIQRRIVHNGERLFIILWDKDSDNDPQPYRAHELEPVQRGESVNQDLIPRSWAWDRKWGIDLFDTVEDREQWRVSTFERI